MMICMEKMKQMLMMTWVRWQQLKKRSRKLLLSTRKRRRMTTLKNRMQRSQESKTRWSKKERRKQKEHERSSTKKYKSIRTRKSLNCLQVISTSQKMELSIIRLIQSSHQVTRFWWEWHRESIDLKHSKRRRLELMMVQAIWAQEQWRRVKTQRKITQSSPLNLKKHCNSNQSTNQRNTRASRSTKTTLMKLTQQMR